MLFVHIQKQQWLINTGFCPNMLAFWNQFRVVLFVGVGGWSQEDLSQTLDRDRSLYYIRV